MEALTLCHWFVGLQVKLSRKEGIECYADIPVFIWQGA